MKSLLAIILLISITYGSAWGQGVKPTSISDLAKYTGADRERILYEGAKKEGKLVWYTSLVPYKEIAKVFEAKYPGIAVDIYRATGSDIANRILAESQAKRYIVDVIEATPPSLMPLRDSQLLLPYNSPHLARYPDVAKEKNSQAWSFGRRTVSR